MKEENRFGPECKKCALESLGAHRLLALNQEVVTKTFFPGVNLGGP
jgi:hypothetical protein